MNTKPILGAFSQGIIPTIACFNRATTPLGVDFDKLIETLQTYVDKYVAPVWGTPAKLVKTKGFKKNAWAMVFLDDADQPGALAYHDLTPDGLPQAKVFVKTTIKNGDLVSVSASHELVEMLVDPATNLMTTGPDPSVVYGYESADPVEELPFEIDGIAMSDFVYPSYFETFHKPGSVKFDEMGAVKQPFELLKGGYQIIYKDAKWGQVWGSEEKAMAFAKEDRRGHRCQARTAGNLQRADLDAIAKEQAAAQHTRLAG